MKGPNPPVPLLLERSALALMLSDSTTAKPLMRSSNNLRAGGSYSSGRGVINRVSTSIVRLTTESLRLRGSPVWEYLLFCDNVLLLSKVVSGDSLAQLN